MSRSSKTHARFNLFIVIASHSANQQAAVNKAVLYKASPAAGTEDYFYQHFCSQCVISL